MDVFKRHVLREAAAATLAQAGKSQVVSSAPYAKGLIWAQASAEIGIGPSQVAGNPQS